jgi:putative thioredoxin
MTVTDGAATQTALVKDTTTAEFRTDVIAESMKQPVLVDFWAPWCGPCKQLAPLIEKVVKEAGGKVKLVKMNIDEHPQIAGQLGIQSIPAVIAFQRGQPVDGFMGAQGEREIKGFIERMVGPLGPGATAQLLEKAKMLAEGGDAAGAAELYAAVLTQEPDNAEAIGAMSKLHVDLGDLEGAERFLGMTPKGKEDHPAVAGARAALELAKQAGEIGDLADLERKVATNPADHQSRFDLALALATRGNRERATDELVEIIKRDRGWNDDGARRQLLQFFDAWGPMDDMTVAGRRKLSAVLFR